MTFLKSRKTKRVTTVLGATLGASLMFVTQASAWSGDWNGPGGGGGGDITFISDTTASWDFTIVDTHRDGFCTRAKIIVDRPNGWTDVPRYQTNYACGFQQGVRWKGSYETGAGTKMRSLKIEQCILHSDGDDEVCQEKLRIYNPKY